MVNPFPNRKTFADTADVAWLSFSRCPVTIQRRAMLTTFPPHCATNLMKTNRNIVYISNTFSKRPQDHGIKDWNYRKGGRRLCH